MKTAYICSPYRAENIEDWNRNMFYARHLTHKAIKSNYAPITPHLYLTQALNDDIEAERNQGLSVGLELLKKCDILIVGDKYGISEGMKLEIREAEQLGIKIEVVIDWI